MEKTFTIINQVLPIILLLLLGGWIQYKNFLTNATIEDLRKIVVNFALPAVLFTSFLNVEMKWDYIITFGIVFLLCVLLLLLGKFIGGKFAPQYSYFPYLITGFEYGMLGVSLFGAAYGLEKIGYIAVMDLGHEIFIWFVFLPLLLIKRDGSQNPTGIIRSFLSTPVVVAILAGITLNILGAGKYVAQAPFVGGVMSTLGFLGNLTVPLILIIVGYGIKINRAGLSKAVSVVVLRLGILISIVLILNNYLIKGYMHLEKLFGIALFTLFILPPPFIIPLYARTDIEVEEKQYINNVLAIYTVVSILIFLVYFALNQ
jgi:predicted permease